MPVAEDVLEPLLGPIRDEYGDEGRDAIRVVDDGSPSSAPRLGCTRSNACWMCGVKRAASRQLVASYTSVCSGFLGLATRSSCPVFALRFCRSRECDCVTCVSATRPPAAKRHVSSWVSVE